MIAVQRVWKSSTRSLKSSVPPHLAEKMHREEEGLLQQQRSKDKPAAAPARNAGEDTIAGVVGKKKQGSNKFILWESETGMLLNDQCTWQQGESGLK